MIDNLAIVVYTNETNIPILELFLKYFFKHNNFNYSIYVVSNGFVKDNLPYQDKVTYLSGNVEWEPNGKHFSQTLLNVLPQIKEDYIFYFCEDYILTDPINTDLLKNLLNLIQDENVDLFTFSSTYPINSHWRIFDVDYHRYGFEPNIFYTVDNQFRHAYSVQPCIWKKSSLHQLLEDNPKISLHDMDNSILVNKDNYKIISTKYKIYDLCCPADYFVIGYKEVIRHGVFLINLNGYNFDPNNHGEIFIKKLIIDENLLDNPNYNRYLLFTKEQFYGEINNI